MKQKVEKWNKKKKEKETGKNRAFTVTP